jgi:O-acetyl-ADP-ribose deacetylase (regulator of RNase III)
MRKTIKGDITTLHVDAIVNAANNSLLGGGGVDGAIHKAAGPQLVEECKELGGCPTGEARITQAYNLPSKYVIHAVGPVWQGGKNNEVELLASAYRSSLNLAAKNGCKSIAFPNISTGVYNFPKRDAAELAIRTCQQFLDEHGDDMQIIFVCHDEINYMIYKEICPSFNQGDSQED